MVRVSRCRVLNVMFLRDIVLIFIHILVLQAMQFSAIVNRFIVKT